MDWSMPGLSVSHHLPEFAQVHVQWICDAIQPSHPLLPSSPSALTLSQHQGHFQWVNSLHKVAKYWSFSFSISPSKEYSGLIFFRTNCGVDSKANLLGACTVLWNIEFLDLQYTCIVFRHKNDDIYFFNKLFFTLANKDVCIGRLAACHKSLTRTTKSGGVTLQSEWR